MLKQFVITIALVSFLGAYTLAQEKPDTDKKEKKDGLYKKDFNNPLKKKKKKKEKKD